jgi:hypothetical protein
MGTLTRLSSPGGRPPRGKRLPLEKLADPAPCQDQIDKVIENQGNQVLQSIQRYPAAR